jgi:hypothetical protein
MKHGNSDSGMIIPRLTPPGMSVMSPYPDMPDNRVSAQSASPETLDALLREVLQAMKSERADRNIRRDVIWKQAIPVQQVALTGGAGILVNPTLLAAPPDCIWDLKRLAVWGWSAGTVTVYITNPANEVLLPYSVPGTATFGKAQALLDPGEYLYVDATGITGNVYVAGMALCMKSWYMQEYVGLWPFTRSPRRRSYRKPVILAA